MDVENDIHLTGDDGRPTWETQVDSFHLINPNLPVKGKIIMLKEVSIIGLRKTHFEQLLQNVIDMEREGSYYGNKEQHMERQEDLKRWLNTVIDLFEGMKRTHDEIIDKEKGDERRTDAETA